MNLNVWEQFCSEMDAIFIKGGFWQGDRISIKSNNWNIILDIYTETNWESMVIECTRIRAPYLTKDGFRFIIYRKDLFSKIGHFMGIKDIEIGYPDFERDFIIKGNDDSKLKALFADSRIRQLIQSQPDIYLEIKDNKDLFGQSLPKNVYELHFQVVGVIQDIGRLRSLYKLFVELLNQLCNIGSAYEDDPGIIL